MFFKKKSKSKTLQLTRFRIAFGITVSPTEYVWSKTYENENVRIKIMWDNLALWSKIWYKGVKVAETVYRENWWNEEEKLFHELPEHIILEINSTIDIVYEDIQNKISIKKKELLDRYTEEERILNSQ